MTTDLLRFAVASGVAHETPLADRLAASEARGGYRVRAVWRTLQGEGAFAGHPAVFVRFAGCNMWSGEEATRQRDVERIGAACALFCDTDFRREGSVRLSPDALAAEVLRVADDGRAGDGHHDPGPRLVVLTGGEPLLQADAPARGRAAPRGLLRGRGDQRQHRPRRRLWIVDDGPDWVACSPKRPDAEVRIEACDELKLVVPEYTPDLYPALAARVRPQRLGGREVYYRWLQPEDGPRLAEAQRLAVALTTAHPAWRVSVQTHKLLGVD